ncbi:MAG: hypothetical protein M3Y82_00125 [Verrucomicrobiota bacterium]|nr:hypothetical protein [Verrucomicrobiota bacterium]
MAENPNLPSGLPPKPAEAAKVQPKKETVRINLPPKPTASATIKLPTLPPSGPAAKPGAPVIAAAPAPASASPIAPKAAMPPAAPAPRPKSSVSVQRPSPSAAAPAPPAPSPGKRAPAPLAAVSGVDKALAIGAAIMSVVALGTVVYLGWFLTNAPAS